jgi:hypothetical protein
MDERIDHVPSSSLIVAKDEEIETKASLHGFIAVRKTTPGEGPSLPSLAQRVERLEERGASS